MTMIFRHGFFHGDPHPANVLVLGSPERIGLVDFGLAGKLSDDDMTKLTRLFIDAANENVEALPKRLADLGVRYDKIAEDEFVAALRELYDRYYGARLAEIDPMQLIREGFQLIYAMNLRLPTRFLLLDKSIATLGAVGVELYEDFNVFEVAKPYARDLVLQRLTPQRLLRDARKEALSLGAVLREAPYQMRESLTTCRDGRCRRSCPRCRATWSTHSRARSTSRGSRTTASRVPWSTASRGRDLCSGSPCRARSCPCASGVHAAHGY